MSDSHSSMVQLETMEEDALQGSLGYHGKISINCLYIIMILHHN